MNKNVTRIGLAAIAAFYVVVGGLWASQHFPLQKFYAQMELKDDLYDRLGVSGALKSEEFMRASAYQERYALTHPDIMVTERRLDLYKSLLLWATVGFAVGGGVLFLTRGNRGAQAIQGDAQ